MELYFNRTNSHSIQSCRICWPSIWIWNDCKLSVIRVDFQWPIITSKIASSAGLQSPSQKTENPPKWMHNISSCKFVLQPSVFSIDSWIHQSHSSEIDPEAASLIASSDDRIVSMEIRCLDTCFDVDEGLLFFFHRFTSNYSNFSMIVFCVILHFEILVIVKLNKCQKREKNVFASPSLSQSKYIYCEWNCMPVLYSELGHLRSHHAHTSRALVWNRSMSTKLE